MRRVILVAGPPCAGKSTYVREHASPGALVLDRDAMGGKAYNRLAARIHSIEGEAWIIRCAAGEQERARFARSMGCTEPTVLLCPDEATLIQRATERPNPRATIAAIRAWFLKEHGLTRVRNPHRTGHRARQVRAATFAEHGTVCAICGHDGATESGHVTSLAVAPGQPLSVDGRLPVHGSSAPCPVCQRACNQEQGTKSMGETFIPKVAW